MKNDDFEGVELNLICSGLKKVAINTYNKSQLDTIKGIARNIGCKKKNFQPDSWKRENIKENTTVMNYEKSDGLGKFGIKNSQAIRTGKNEMSPVIEHCMDTHDTTACLKGALRAIKINEHSNYDRHKGRRSKLIGAIKHRKPEQQQMGFMLSDKVEEELKGGS